MRYKQLIAGMLLGALTGYAGTFLVYYFLYRNAMPNGFHFYLLNVPELIAPCMQLGLLPNGLLFFLLLKLNRDDIARGVLAITMVFIIALLYIVFI